METPDLPRVSRMLWALELSLYVDVTGAGRLEPGPPLWGVSGRPHPGARWPETPNSRGFWPSRTRKPRFSGGELVEAKCIVSYF